MLSGMDRNLVRLRSERCPESPGIRVRLGPEHARWIRERAEALLQLRCIDLHGDWEAFMAFVEKKATQQARWERKSHRILTGRPAPLPQLGLTA